MKVGRSTRIGLLLPGGHLCARLSGLFRYFDSLEKSMEAIMTLLQNGKFGDFSKNYSRF